MTDIYINRHPAKKKWVFTAFFLAALLAVVFWRTLPGSLAEPDQVQESTIPAPEPNTDSQTPVPPSDTRERLARIKEKIANGNILSARESGLSLLEKTGDHPSRGELETLLGDLHTRLVFSTADMPEKTSHVVQRSETLGILAKRYNTTTDLIAESNGIRNNVIRLGASLNILQGEFSVHVSKSRNDLELRLNDRFFKRYVVGTGTDSSTPTGDYLITLRMRHPVWYRPDGRSFPYGHPENLLGTHYLKLNTPGIGLHGTWEPDSIGSQSSAGCVRLKNEMIEELYKLLPEGTPVRISD
jgi:LysM repeat protein